MPVVSGKLKKANGTSATQVNQIDFYNNDGTVLIATCDTASDGSYAISLATASYRLVVNDDKNATTTPNPLRVTTVPLHQDILSTATKFGPRDPDDRKMLDVIDPAWIEENGVVGVRFEDEGHRKKAFPTVWRETDASGNAQISIIMQWYKGSIPDAVRPKYKCVTQDGKLLKPVLWKVQKTTEAAKPAAPTSRPKPAARKK